MELLVVGDVHGCLHTFSKLIQEHWNRDKQVFVQQHVEYRYRGISTCWAYSSQRGPRWRNRRIHIRTNAPD